MKKILTVLLVFITMIVSANFLDEIHSIDKEIENRNYEKALEKSKNLLKTNISEDEKRTIITLIDEINQKMNNNNVTTLINNLGNVEVSLKTDASLTAVADGTLLVLPTEEISNGTKFSEYKKYEEQIVSTGNSDAINQLAILYIKENLYESAMKVALKDKKRDLKNIYLAATSARMIGKYKESIQLYTEVLKKDSSNPKALLGIAMAYKLNGDNNAALKYLKSYSKYDSSDRIMREIQVLESK